MKYQTDVVVVGAGLAGITCAMELLDQGKRVLIIDRDKASEMGGLAKWSFGGMFFVGTKEQKRAGFTDDFERAKADWWSCAQFAVGEKWGPKWAEQFIHLCTPHGYDWLRHRGLKFLPVVNWVERGMMRQGNSVPRFHIIWGTGWELCKRLCQQLLQHKYRNRLQLLFDHRVLELIKDENAITGVRGKVETNLKDFEVVAQHVVVATGGISGSIEKVRANWHKSMGTPPATILHGAHPYAVGDLHEASEAVGGSVVDLDRQWNYAAGIRHYAPRHPDHGLSLVPGKSQIWINHRGERFGPPALISPFDTRYIVEQICQEEHKYSWQILNYKIARKEFAISGSEHNPAIRDKKLLRFLWETAVVGKKRLVDKIADQCEDFIVADSLEELVERMNQVALESHVDLEGLRHALESYDQELAKGELSKDDQIRRIIQVRKYRGDRIRTCNLQSILDKNARPLVAIRSFILSRKSLGGIQTDLTCRVLTKPNERGEQEAIPNLYAIGEAAGFGGGGMHGQGSLEGTFLGGCIITARVCAAALGGKTLD